MEPIPPPPPAFNHPPQARRRRPVVSAVLTGIFGCVLLGLMVPVGMVWTFANADRQCVDPCPDNGSDFWLKATWFCGLGGFALLVLCGWFIWRIERAGRSSVPS